MTTAIALRRANNVIVRNVWISGFNKGIEAVNSNLLLSGVHVQRSGIGLELINSSLLFTVVNLLIMPST